MPESDPRPAIHATSTSALRAVAVVLAVVLLLAAAMAVLSALPTSSPAAEHNVRSLQYLVLIDSVPTYPTPERRP